MLRKLGKAGGRGAVAPWLAVVGACMALPVFVRAAAGIPATPLMTVYQFDGPDAVPYYEVDRFLRNGPAARAGTVAQGTAVIPCLVVRAGRPLTDKQGTPYVGFEVVVDASTATPSSTARFREVFEQRRSLEVANHHCPPGTPHVIDVRKLVALGKPPSFDPPRPRVQAAAVGGPGSELDEIVRAFHTSKHCEAVNARLFGRRHALRRAWTNFAADSGDRWPNASMARARHLDFVMRTALYEGHLDRGCNAYGACERNVIALSIRNRAVERCARGQGCSAPGDFEGAASKVSQYNIWDETLTQVSGLTSCFLRPDLAGRTPYDRLQAMYEQSSTDVQRILFGTAGDLKEVFPGNSLSSISELRHYFHPPAMGKCFPGHERLEYVSGAVARHGDQFALIANTRVEVGERRGNGYLFRQAVVEEHPDRDTVTFLDRYPGFVIDGRKIELRRASRCTPYGTPRGCRFEEVGRHRRTPSWLASGEPLQLTCRVHARGEDCGAAASLETARVGGRCDTEMQPVAGVP